MKNQKDRLVNLCQQGSHRLGVEISGKYFKRLLHELKEIESQDQFNYFLDAYDRKLRWADNENNLLIPYLLGLCPNFDINLEFAYTIGEFPDIDTDYAADIRDYLKDEWSKRQFGKEYVAHIGTYGTYKMKGALQDMARIFNVERSEVLHVTKALKDKDDDGKEMTFEKAMEIYPEFVEFCNKYPEVADAAKRLTGRNRNIGQHAAGVIVSSVPINEFVPLIRTKDGNIVTSWSEGQSSQDLGSVGLVKYDLLSLDTQDQIKDCIALICKRHNLKDICALPGQGSWSDDSYLNDPECLAEANKGNLKFIFQFHSDGIRALVRKGGVSSFSDMEAYTAIYRPGCLSMGMDDLYCKRKKGEQEYTIPDILKPYLSGTYGILCFQEQIMYTLNKVGRIPMRDCYQVIKAISKKKLDKIAKYREEFIANGQKTIGYTKEEMEKFFSEIEAFAGYGFNKAHACSYTHLSAQELYLKTYYPLEFFCEKMNHIKEQDKLGECIRVAKQNGLKVNSVDINKSNARFEIVDDEIYFGLGSVKHIGFDVAQKIVAIREEGGPYKSFEDFLQRFGTDAKVIQALISLRAFKEYDPFHLFQYYEAYKNFLSKEKTKVNNFSKSINKYKDQFCELTGIDDISELLFADYLSTSTDEDKNKKLRRLLGNYKRTLTRNQENQKKQAENLGFMPIQDFEYSRKYKFKPELYELLADLEKSEEHYYGFRWSHPLDNCIDIDGKVYVDEGFTFAYHKARGYGKNEAGPIDGVVESLNRFVASNGNPYYRIEFLDYNWEKKRVTIWNEEYQRFQDRIFKDAMLRLKLVMQPPSDKFPFESWTLQSYPKWKKHAIPDKDNDLRVCKLGVRPPKELPPINGNESLDTLNSVIAVADANTRANIAKDGLDDECDEYDELW